MAVWWVSEPFRESRERHFVINVLISTKFLSKSFYPILWYPDLTANMVHFHRKSYNKNIFFIKYMGFQNEYFRKKLNGDFFNSDHITFFLCFVVEIYVSLFITVLLKPKSNTRTTKCLRLFFPNDLPII